ncbi:outer membrane beta-barrel protein [Maribacter halichondriae]|uniref:outer membrane beta-barrel protein n=1 Tax=Maribacter halichondriae TaxID=2980554 RepID=UPI002359FD0D|nr:outer membrane beta-barrel protein [Maribacter sp. Hal144]
MKRTLLLAVYAMISITAFAQKDSGFGIKGGLNYGQNGDLVASVGNAAEDIVRGSDGKVGYHFGIFGKIDLLRLYIRPELLYTKTQSGYDVANGTQYDISKLDMPVLVGVKVIGPLHVFAGPTFQYILENELEGLTVNNIEKDFSFGAQFGVGVNLGKIGLDVRYERGLSKNEANFIGDNVTDISGRVDARPSQVIFGLSLKL